MQEFAFCVVSLRTLLRGSERGRKGVHHQTDADEFTNIAKRPEAAAVIERLKAFLPTVNASKTQ